MLHITQPASNPMGVHLLFVMQSGATDIDDRVNRAVELFLFERGAETVNTSVTMDAEGPRLHNYLPGKEDQDRKGCEFS